MFYPFSMHRDWFGAPKNLNSKSNFVDGREKSWPSTWHCLILRETHFLPPGLQSGRPAHHHRTWVRGKKTCPKKQPWTRLPLAECTLRTLETRWGIKLQILKVMLLSTFQVSGPKEQMHSTYRFVWYCANLSQILKCVPLVFANLVWIWNI